jgi:pimeloyl-ACP methyl ester carboxylesterase
LLKLALMRPWAIAAWSRYYASLYPTSPPADLDDYRARLRANLAEPGRLDALKAMIWSSKDSCEARIGEVKARTLVVMGSSDPDFSDPQAEAQWVAEHLHAQTLIVQGAGHYPHAEMPDRVTQPIVQFIGGAGDGVKTGA